MITISRRNISHFRSVCRRAFGQARFATVGFIGSKEGLSVRCASGDSAIEYRIPGKQSEETIWLPLTALDDIEAKSDETVELTATNDGHVTAQWRDKDGQQLTEYESKPPHDAARFPAVPETLAENPPTLLQAFTAASETIDPNPTRYALANVRFRGDDGSLASSDGKQLLRQSGYNFPWKGDVLVANSKVFASRSLPDDRAVLVGKSDQWVTFNVGPWFVHLRIDTNGRYPNVEQIIPATDKAIGSCRFSASDAKFLAEKLPKLPVDDDGTHRVTIDLNGQVVVRAKRSDDAKPTEIVLSGSSWSGKPKRVNVNCTQFARAIKLGLTELHVFDKDAPALWQDDARSYVTAAVPSDSCIESAADAIRIESPKDDATPAAKPKTRKAKPVNETNASGSAQPQTNNQPAKGKTRKSKSGQQNLAKLIDDAVKLRTSLHTLLHDSAELVKSLKQQRRANKAVQQTLDQIRTLKTLVA